MAERIGNMTNPVKAKVFADYSYTNHSGKDVCFHYESEKRAKTKVIDFIKKNHEQSQIEQYLGELGLKLVQTSKSNNYIHYSIIDSEVE